MLLWVGVTVAAVAVILALGLWLALRSGAVHDYLLRSARGRASAAVGAPVALGNFHLRLHGLAPTLELDAVTIAGAAPFASPPLLQLPRARVGLRITSLFPLRWRLRFVELDRPVVHLVFAPGGRTNLPHPPAAGGAGAGPFQLAIGRLVVRGGEAVVNARAVPLRADLRHLEFAAAYQRAAQAYRGRLSFTAGALQVARLPPLPPAFSTDFVATSAGASFSHLRWSTPGAVVTASATLHNYAHPQVGAAYEVQLQTTRLRRLLRLPALPSGAIAAAGEAHYDAVAGFTTRGEFSSAALTAAVAGVAVPVTRLRGRYALARGALTVGGLSAGVLGGTLHASLAIRALFTVAAARLQFRLQGARLEQAAAFAAGVRRTLGQVGIRGGFDAAGSAQWRGPGRGFALAAHATLSAALARRSAPPLPLRGAVQAAYAHGVLRLASAELRTPRSYVRARGTLAAHSSLQLAAGSSDLGELEAIARDVVPVLAAHPLPPLALGGAGTFRGAVSGALAGPGAAPRLTGRLALAPFNLRGSRWRSFALTLAVDRTQLALQDVRLEAAAGGAVAGHATLGLRHGAPTAASPLQAAFTLRALPLAALAPLLGRALPLTGRLSAQADLTGTLAHPQGRGTAALAAAALRLAGVSQPITAATAEFQGTSATLQAQIQLRLPAGAVTASGTFSPATGAYQAELAAPQLALGQLAWLRAHASALVGVVALTASGRGTLAAPAGELTLTSARLAAAGQAITGLRLHAALARRQIQAQLAATALDTPIQAQAEIALAPGLPAALSVNAPAIPLAPLLAAAAPGLAARLEGRTAVQAELHGPLRHLAALQADITLPTFELRYPPGLRLAAAAPLRLTLAAGVLTLAPATLDGTDTHLTLQARVPLRAGALQVALQGQVGLRLAQLFAPGLTFGGQAALKLAVTGPLAHPVFGGEVGISGASVSSPTFPLALVNGHGLLRISAQRLQIASFTADAGGGRITATGGMALRPGVRFDVGIAARDIGVRYPDSVREQVSADLSLLGTPQAAQLNGRAQVTRVSVLPAFDFTRFIGQLADGGPAVSAPGSFPQALALNVAVTTPNRIAITTRDFSLDANANVSLRGTAAEPVLLGRMDLDRGDLIFNGQRFQLSGGTLDFANPARTEPTVNVTATASINQYNLHLSLQGPTDNLRTTYTSNPPLPPADIINLLAFGATTEASAASPLPGNLGAESILAGAVSGQITDRVQKLVGISQLSVDPVLRGGQQNAGARITVQQRVTGNLFVTFSTDTTGTTRNVVEIQYNFTPRVSLSAVRNQNGGFGVTTRFKKVW